MKKWNIDKDFDEEIQELHHFETGNELFDISVAILKDGRVETSINELSTNLTKDITVSHAKMLALCEAIEIAESELKELVQAREDLKNEQ